MHAVIAARETVDLEEGHWLLDRTGGYDRTGKQWGANVTSYLFSGGRFLDPRKDELQDGISVLIEDGT